MRHPVKWWWNDCAGRTPAADINASDSARGILFALPQLTRAACCCPCAVLPGAAAMMKPSSSRKSSTALCQVLGCTADLSKGHSSYCVAKRICTTHLRVRSNGSSPCAEDACTDHTTPRRLTVAACPSVDTCLIQAKFMTLPGHGPHLYYRFCQQCGRLHLLSDFDGNKR